MNLEGLTASRVSLLVSLLGSLLAATPAAADSITVMWDMSPEPTIGYVVYSGTQSGNYSTRLDVGSTSAFTIGDALAGQQYCFAVSAYDYSAPSVEGPKSPEVCGLTSSFPTLINPGTQTGTVGQQLTLQLQGGDPDGGPVSYSADGLPPGLSLMQDAGFISGSPTTAGNFAVRASVSDGVLSSTQAFNWLISSPSAPAPVSSPSAPAPAPASAFTLTGKVVGYSDWTDIRLTWTAAAGREAYVYLNGVRVRRTANDGSCTMRDDSGRSRYRDQYQICTDAGLCSNTIEVSY